MTTAGVNSSINNLIGTFATVNTGSYQPIPNKLVCIDTSNNRIGVNTIDPSYGIHVVGQNDNDDNGTISSNKIISNNLTISGDSISNTKIIFKGLPTYSSQLDLDQKLELGQLYIDNSGMLKIFNT